MTNFLVFSLRNVFANNTLSVVNFLVIIQRLVQSLPRQLQRVLHQALRQVRIMRRNLFCNNVSDR